jgi:arginine:ornithine antiporter / lysine permease
MILGVVATVYGAWLIYAAGPNYLLMCALLYAPGILVYWWARRTRNETGFSPVEAIVAAAIVIAAGVAGYLMWTGSISAL